MSKVLVTYATKTGSVTDIAEKIGAALADGADVDVTPVGEDPWPSGYDAVVVGSGVRMARWEEPAKGWVEKHADTLRAMPVAFFTVGLVIAEGPEKADEVRAYTDPIIELSGVKPVDVGLFAGWGLRSKFGLGERLILSAMKGPEEDLRDFAAVEAWAKSIAPKLEAS